MTHRHVPALACALAFALGTGLAGAPASAQGVAAERGRQVAARWCTDCHATGTTTRAGDVGPTFEEIAARRSDDFLRGFLSDPHVRGSMPPFELAREHVGDLVAYIRSLE